MGESKKKGVFLSDCVFWSFSAERFMQSHQDTQIIHVDYVVIDLDTVSHNKIKTLLGRHNIKIYGVSNNQRKREQYSCFLEAIFCKTISMRQIIKFANNHFLYETRFNHVELSLLRFLKQGLSDAVIAKKQQLPTSTIKYYLRCLYQKLGVENRTQAAMVMVKNNI